MEEKITRILLGKGVEGGVLKEGGVAIEGGIVIEGGVAIEGGIGGYHEVGDAGAG